MVYNIAIDGPAGAGKSTIAKKGCKGAVFYLCRYGSDVSGNGPLSDSERRSAVKIPSRLQMYVRGGNLYCV